MLAQWDAKIVDATETEAKDGDSKSSSSDEVPRCFDFVA